MFSIRGRNPTPSRHYHLKIFIFIVLRRLGLSSTQQVLMTDVTGGPEHPAAHGSFSVAREVRELPEGRVPAVLSQEMQDRPRRPSDFRLREAGAYT